jgi:hypothetical protein
LAQPHKSQRRIGSLNSRHAHSMHAIHTSAHISCITHRRVGSGSIQATSLPAASPHRRCGDQIRPSRRLRVQARPAHPANARSDTVGHCARTLHQTQHSASRDTRAQAANAAQRTSMTAIPTENPAILPALSVLNSWK